MSAYLRRVLNVYDPEYATYAYFILWTRMEDKHEYDIVYLTCSKIEV